MTLDLLTTKEAALLLRVSERHIKDELRRKHLRGTKPAGKWRIERADLEAYADAKANVSRVRKASA